MRQFIVSIFFVVTVATASSGGNSGSYLPASTGSTSVEIADVNGLSTALSGKTDTSDSRLTNTRTPTDGSVTDAKVAGGAAIAESKLNLGSDAAAGTASRRTLGTGATQAAAGNDARFTDNRTPSDASVTDAKVAGGASISESKLNLATDAAAGTGSRRTLGAGATQAAAGNDSRFTDTRTPTDNTVSTAKIQSAAVTYAKMQNLSANQKILGRKTSGAGVTEELSITDILNWLGTPAQGDFAYRNGSSWTLLHAGTAGQILTTQGSTANPTWENRPSGGVIGYARFHNSGITTVVSSVSGIISDAGHADEGLYTVSFTTSEPDKEYQIDVSIVDGNDDNVSWHLVDATDKTVDGFQFYTYGPLSTHRDVQGEIVVTVTRLSQ